jgi:hypothetical protein
MINIIHRNVKIFLALVATESNFYAINQAYIVPNSAANNFCPCWHHTKPSYFFTLKYFRAAVVGLQGRLGSPAYQQLEENH